ncbi:5-formyltetrahydrofolate cyclo-ligase [Uliginosibacterium aquaticum]|uniref:5-formyltetrahydrofolate cyclo-ligase n=1 Tax=Uliginosibacterium aquaticum TaxID=2731212 RepID=A0ABX2IGA4_9RHOO|nr:5-formyltetrahydrofolate cyclo-ligase [Uliginosibacterium aquaticum]NSL55746.1 5-formyltetrahydrofolate cyclo-ligase [Uliginosibacterium aquaticum]
MSSAALDRRALREALIAERETQAPMLRLQLTHALLPPLGDLLDRLEPSVLGFCWPYRGEPDLREFLSLWRAQGRGRELALPVVHEQAASMAFHAWRPGVPMAPDRFGIPAPQGTVILHPDVLIVPVNGFDARGYRIGYGGGFFDRTLAALQPKPVTVGVGFEIARLEDVQPEPHDVPLDWILTEDGIVVSPQ